MRYVKPRTRINWLFVAAGGYAAAAIWAMLVTTGLAR
jgi:hypothetical protein